MIGHDCGYKQAPPRQCPQCGKMEVRYQGLGTEKLLTEIEERFPGTVVRRMDSDSMRRPGSHGRILNAFRRGLIDILVGTQMIAKGLDFPNVMLVGVVNADMGLHVPDFRSAERPVFRLKGFCRFHFQLQSASPAALHQLLRTVLSGIRPPAGVEFTLDIDPLNML